MKFDIKIMKAGSPEPIITGQLIVANDEDESVLLDMEMVLNANAQFQGYRYQTERSWFVYNPTTGHALVRDKGVVLFDGQYNDMPDDVRVIAAGMMQELGGKRGLYPDTPLSPGERTSDLSSGTATGADSPTAD